MLVEGTSGVGKSTIIDALIRRHVSTAEPRKIRSLIHLAQSHTYGPVAVPEDDGTLTPAQDVAHLERIVSMMEWLHASVREHVRPWCFVVIDTLHVTHCVRPGVVNWLDVEEVDRRLAAIDCRLLFVEASPSTIWERGVRARIDDQFIWEYARKFGQTPEQIHSYFVSEQARLLNLVERSKMRHLVLRSESTLESAAETAFQFWTAD